MVTRFVHCSGSTNLTEEQVEVMASLGSALAYPASAEVRCGLRDDTSALATTNALLGEYRVSELDQKNGPHDLGQVEGAGQRTCGGSGGLPTTLFSESKVIDMDQGTRTLARTHSTPPWCQQRVSDGWPFGGVLAFGSVHVPTCASGVEGVGMT